MPLGAFVSSGEIMKCLTHDPPLGHITTFGGHPVSCAAGLAAQEFIMKEKLVEASEKMGDLYRERMVHPEITGIRGKGLFLAVEFSDRIDGKKLMKNIFERQIILDQFLFCANAFRIAPPLIITEAEVKTSADLLLDAIDHAGK